jgi:formamidopyrimidine-DNA glycosylase
MPEVCEVVIASHFLTDSILDKKLINIKILSGRYTHQKLKGIELIKENKPLKIINIDTKGKFLWIVMENKEKEQIYLLNTFGMSGEWDNNKTKSSRLEFILDDDTRIYYTDQRNFGTVELTNDYKILEKKLNKLGQDFLKTDISNKNFIDQVRNFKYQNKNLYEVLMNQEQNKGLGSGLGNYLVPEVLYKAKLSPFRKIKDLSDKDIKTLLKSIKYITKLCYVNNHIGYMEAFGEYLKVHKKHLDSGKYPEYHEDIKLGKEEFEFKVYQQEKDLKGNKVKKDEIIKGRTAHWVPEVQK